MLAFLMGILAAPLGAAATVPAPVGELRATYVVEWGDRRLYFTGDTESTEALLAARGLDVAFVSPWLLRAVQGRRLRIDAGQVVVYHHQAEEAVPEVQGRILPRQGSVLALGRERHPPE